MYSLSKYYVLKLMWNLKALVLFTESQLVEYKPTEVLPDLFDLATLTKDDEESLSSTLNTPDIGNLGHYNIMDNQHVSADDLDW